MLSFLCKDRRDWEEPGHLKFFIALQEDAGKNFSYLVPMNIVNSGEGEGDNLLWMDKIKILADFAPDLSEGTLHLFSYVSLHDCIILINFCYTALGLEHSQ